MNSIRVKSGSFEIEIQTDQPQTPKQMAEAIIDVVKAAPPAKAHILDVKEVTPALPAIDTSLEEQARTPDVESTSPKVAKGRRRKTIAKNNGETAPRAPSAADKIEELILAGKFDVPQALKDVHSMQERMALNYSKTHIANALAELVRKDKLERIGPKNEYKYIRKGIRIDQPPVATAEEKTVDANVDANNRELNQAPSAQDMTLEAAMAQAQN